MMRRGRSATAAVLAVVAMTLAGCGGDDDGDDGSSASPEASGLDADATTLVDCLDEAGIAAEVNDSEAFGVESDHVGVEAADLPSELLKFDSGSGTTTGVDLWVFASADDAETARTAITLSDADDDKSWVDGRVVVRWYYPVNREAEQAVAVDDCVADLNAG
jgi:hypothetical protein